MAPRAHSAKEARNSGWSNIGTGTNIGGGSAVPRRIKVTRRCCSIVRDEEYNRHGESDKEHRADQSYSEESHLASR